MKHKNQIKLAIAAAALLLPVSLFAQETVIDNFEDGNSKNKLGDLYWWYYDDGDNGGESVRPEEFEGEYGPGYESDYCGQLEYELDPRTRVDADSLVAPYVAMGTSLAPDDEVVDISEATHITFWARAEAPTNVRVKLEMASVTGDNKYQMHKPGDETDYGIEVDPTWQQYTMNLVDVKNSLEEVDGLVQENWGPQYDYGGFDLAEVTKLVFEIKKEDGFDNPESGTFQVDDIILHGFEVTPADIKVHLVGEPGTETGALLSDNEGDWPTANKLGYYWYCYADDESSEIFDGAEDGELVIEGNGYDGTNAAYIGFQLGTTYEDASGNLIEPFVGLGTMLSNDLGTTLFDADETGATGIYFDYKTNDEVEEVMFELGDEIDRVPGADVAYFVKLPGTEGEWKSASVPFDSLGLPNWDDIRKLSPDLKRLHTEALKKMQWKVQGAEGMEGELAVDNVHLIGGELSARGRTSFARAGMKVNHVNNAINISLMPKTKDVSLAVISPLGRLVARHTIAAGQTSVSLPASNLADGVYLLNITGLDKTSISMPLMIMR